MVCTEGLLLAAFEATFMSQDRNGRGRFTERVSLTDVLGVFDQIDGPVLTSGDVVEATGCSRDSARRKFDQLEDRGQIKSRKTAGRLVYWRTSSRDVSPVNADDPLFTDRPAFSSGRSDLSTSVDELLYGDS